MLPSWHDRNGQRANAYFTRASILQRNDYRAQNSTLHDSRISNPEVVPGAALRLGLSVATMQRVLPSDP